MLEQYHYYTEWEAADKVFVAYVEEFPTLAAHGNSEEQALVQIKAVVATAIDDMHYSGETPPPPNP